MFPEQENIFIYLFKTLALARVLILSLYMINKKNILIAFILFCIVGSFYYLKLKNTEQRDVKEIAPPVENNVIFGKQNIKAFLLIQDEKYDGEVEEDSTVLDIMQKVKLENDKFDFKYTEHTGLGAFINEINGIRGGEGGYWIYYVNGIEANVGVSNYKIKNGDVISWKYEK